MHNLFKKIQKVVSIGDDWTVDACNTIREIIKRHTDEDGFVYLKGESEKKCAKDIYPLIREPQTASKTVFDPYQRLAKKDYIVLFSRPEGNGDVYRILWGATNKSQVNEVENLFLTKEEFNTLCEKHKSEIKTKYHKMLPFCSSILDDTFNHYTALRDWSEDIDEDERETEEKQPVNPGLKPFILDPLFCQWELNHVKQNRLFIDDFYKRIFDGLKEDNAVTTTNGKRWFGFDDLSTLG